MVKLQRGISSQGFFWNRGIISEFRQNLGVGVSLVGICKVFKQVKWRKRRKKGLTGEIRASTWFYGAEGGWTGSMADCGVEFAGSSGSDDQIRAWAINGRKTACTALRTDQWKWTKTVDLAYFYEIGDFWRFFGMTSAWCHLAGSGYGMVTWLLTRAMTWQRTCWRDDDVSRWVARAQGSGGLTRIWHHRLRDADVRGRRAVFCFLPHHLWPWAVSRRGPPITSGEWRVVGVRQQNHPSPGC